MVTPESDWIITLFTACGALYLNLSLGHLHIFLKMTTFSWIFLFQGVQIILALISLAVFALSLSGQVDRQDQIHRQNISAWVI